MQYGCSTYGQFEFSGTGGLIQVLSTALASWENLSPLSKGVVSAYEDIEFLTHSALNNLESLKPITSTAMAQYESLLHLAVRCASDIENQLKILSIESPAFESLLQGLRAIAGHRFEANVKVLSAKLANTETLATLSAAKDHTFESLVAIFSELDKSMEVLEGLQVIRQTAVTPCEMPLEVISVMILASIAIWTAATLSTVQIIEAAHVNDISIVEAM